MAKPIPFIRRRLCATCGRAINLDRHRHVCITTTVGARRYHHATCIPPWPRRSDFDLAA